MVSESNTFTQRKLLTKISGHTLEWLYLAALFAAAIFIGLFATASGPGISPDSVTYISMGANLHRGAGFVSNLAGPFDVTNVSPVTNWPPGYSLMIAGLMFFQIGAVEAARWVGILCLAILLVLVYWLGKKIADRWIGIISSIAVLSMMPVLRLSTFALSEMPFALFITAAVASFVKYFQAKPGMKIVWLCLASFSTAMAVLTRYIGLLLIPIGLLVLCVGIALQSWSKPTRKGLRDAFLNGLLFTLIAVGPIFPWFIRNQELTGHFSGSDRLSGFRAPFVQNVRYELGTLASNILPSIHFGLRGIFSQVSAKAQIGMLIFALLLIALGWFLSRRYWRGFPLQMLFKKASLKNPVYLTWFVVFAFVALYLASLAPITSIVYFPVYDWPRLLATIYPLMMILLFGTWWIVISVLLNHYPIWSQRLIFSIPAGLIVVFYAIQSAGFVSLASHGQELSLSEWRENQGIAWLEKNINQGDVIFSDKPEPVSYWLDRSVHYLPYRSEIAQFTNFLANPSTSPDGNRYLIAFKGSLGQPDPYLPERLSASDLEGLSTKIPGFIRVQDFADSTIYEIPQ